ncbi:MAG: hypothetical protein Q8Q15_04580 [bacterium]|nr:hypothetical protein [bacterium]
MLKTIFIFGSVYVAMIAMAFWESEVEGKKAWDKGKLGWKIQCGKYCLPAYHFFVFVVMWPVLLSLPLIVNGWDAKLFGILTSAYFSGLVLEDFLWFIVNPAIKFSESFSPKFASHYPWLKIWKLQFPLTYLIGLSLSLLSWFFFWR